jgi:Chaperone of endosialidase
MSSSAITGPILSDTRRAPAGTAAAPSFAFNDSTGTGVYLVSAGVLGLSTNGVQRVVVDASGNVGIGTASPASRLHIANAGDTPLRIQNTLNSTLAIAGADSAGAYFGSFTNHAAVFYTNSAERMRIDAGGNLLVGTTVSATNTHQLQGTTNPGGTPVLYVRKPAVSLNISGNSYIEFLAASGGFEGYLGVAGTTLQVVDASDARKKENIRPANYGLKEIQALKPTVFDWKEEFGGEKNIKGFIAQEVKEVLPECVTTKDESEHGGFSDSHFLGTATMIPVLVAAIQEQQEIIEKQSQALDALEARLAALEGK